MRFSAAILASVALHATLGAAVGLYLAKSPRTITIAKLDLSSVELSVSEATIEEEAPPVEELPPPPPEPEPPPPPPPEPEPPPKLPEPVREPEAVKLPEPKPTPPKPIAAPVPKPKPVEAAPKQARVVAQPKLRQRIKPEYPSGSRQRGEQGVVELEIRVNQRGWVDDVKIVKSTGFRELDEAAIKATKKARFEPAKEDGKSVASSARISLDFRLK